MEIVAGGTSAVLQNRLPVPEYVETSNGRPQQRAPDQFALRSISLSNSDDSEAPSS